METETPLRSEDVLWGRNEWAQAFTETKSVEAYHMTCNGKGNRVLCGGDGYYYRFVKGQIYGPLDEPNGKGLAIGTIKGSQVSVTVEGQTLAGEIEISSRSTYSSYSAMERESEQRSWQNTIDKLFEFLVAEGHDINVVRGESAVLDVIRAQVDGATALSRAFRHALSSPERTRVRTLLAKAKQDIDRRIDAAEPWERDQHGKMLPKVRDERVGPMRDIVATWVSLVTGQDQHPAYASDGLGKRCRSLRP